MKKFRFPLTKVSLADLFESWISKSPTVAYEAIIVTAGAKPIKESRNVTTLTARKMVHSPIPNCLFFFLKSVTT